ncbi:hypothetical protein T05_11416 [Trichinella murrelli]|uniref:DUF7041 domain-containing protein n=1 Tax=Trichinella murrelli TaxID=144512 RepID=A0A0V0T629_9BILA|nr:hypothetical protein T05_11416 [Trichinella murrelli]
MEASFWFAQAQAQFQLRHISASLAKYYYVILSLPDSVAPDVDDLLEPVGDIPLRNVEEPHSGTLRRIGRRPLQPTYDSKRLPLNIQMILIAKAYSNTEELAEKADKLVAVSGNGSGSVYAVRQRAERWQSSDP